MTRRLDADVTIAYVRELAKEWRRDTVYFLARLEPARARDARKAAIVLEELAKQLDQQAVAVKVA